MNVDDFDKGMTQLEQFYSRKLTNHQRDLWFAKLWRMSQQAFLFAIERVTSSSSTFPVPDKVIDAATGFRLEVSDKEKINCPDCKSLGFISAKIKTQNAVFRCSCRIGDTLCKDIPLWDYKWQERGWEKI